MYYPIRVGGGGWSKTNNQSAPRTVCSVISVTQRHAQSENGRERHRANNGAATETAAIDAASEAVLNRLKVNISLKSELHLALKAFIQKRDVFCVLPTGFKQRQMQADPNPRPFEIAQTGHNTRPRDVANSESGRALGWIQATNLH